MIQSAPNGGGFDKKRVKTPFQRPKFICRFVFNWKLMSKQHPSKAQSPQVQKPPEPPLKIASLWLLLKRNVALWALILLTIWMTYPKIINYWQPVYFEDTDELTSDTIRRADTTHKTDAFTKPSPSLNFIEAIKIRFETERAFLPYEKIKVSARLGIFNKSLQEMPKRGDSLYLMFPFAQLTESSINKDNAFKTEDFPDNIDPNLKLLISFNVYDATLLLRPTENANEYYGEAEIVYRKQGTYGMALFYKYNPPPQNLNIKIDIASNVEVMNKKTNDLLFILTVVNILFVIYTTFFKFNRAIPHDSKV
jgi:hypothetical protein